jgi:hypothetical protein
MRQLGTYRRVILKWILTIWGLYFFMNSNRLVQINFPENLYYWYSYKVANLKSEIQSLNKNVN